MKIIETSDFSKLPVTEGLDVYALPGFLKSHSSGEFGWYFTDNFIWPYFVADEVAVNHPLFKPFKLTSLRFTGIPISIKEGGDLKTFIESTLTLVRKKGVDFIQGAPYRYDIYEYAPNGSINIPFGTLVVDLSGDESQIFEKIQSRYRQDIRKMEREGFTVSHGDHLISICNEMTIETRQRQGVSISSKEKLFSTLRNELGKKIEFFVVNDREGAPHGCVVIVWEKGRSAYSLYGGSSSEANKGAGKLLYWEAFKYLKAQGVLKFNFVGARLNVDQGSKFFGIQQFKERMGSTLVTGMIWKIPLKKIKYQGFITLKKITQSIRGKTYSGDIIDQEAARLQKHKGVYG